MKSNELLTAYIEQSKLMGEMVRTHLASMKPGDSPLVEVVRQQQETINKMQETLDRIVTAKFDRPVFVPQKHEADLPPQGMLFDQYDPISAGIENLTAESDAAFLNAVGAK